MIVNENASILGTKPLDEAVRVRIREQMPELKNAFSGDPVVLEVERRVAMQEVQSDLVNLSPVPDGIAGKITALGMANSVSQILELKTIILQEIKEALAVSNTGKTIGVAPMTDDARMRQLWTDFKQCEKEIRDDFEKLYAQGKITREQMDYLRRERARLDALPEKSDERIAAEKQFTTYQEVLGTKIQTDAQNVGDHATAELATNVAKLAANNSQRLEELHRLQEQKQLWMQQRKGRDETLHTQKAGMRIGETDNPPDTNNAPSGKLPVADVSHDDIQAPSGGKDHSIGRAPTFP